ncbi:MAG: N-acetylmuramoyl-L-alanine amidase [Lachnospira sp.]|nr:N-acetylmuramoyl-L-alanine amidase [Lachnospira sp.]
MIMNYTNSPLVTYKKISPNKTSPRNHVIDTITIHCMAGNLTLESCGNIFAQSKNQASSNYGIDSKGNIALYVEEKDRSWCSSNPANDHRAVTIEVANDGDASTGWHVSDKALNALIRLVTDICKRNHIKELKWKGDKNLIGQVSKQNMTVHRWFAPKACPGDYLYDKHSYIAKEVNKKLSKLS